MARSTGHPRPLPTLRRKSNGVFFVRIFRRDFSLGSDRVKAESRRAALLEQHYGSVHVAASATPGQLEQQAEAAAASPISAASPIRGALVAELVQPFLESVRTEIDEPARVTVAALPASVNRPAKAVTYYAKHLKRFVALHGRYGIARLAMPVPDRRIYQAPVVTLLFALRDDMIAKGYGPRTVRHDMQAVERLFNWAAARGYCPSVVFTQATKVRVPKPEPLPVPLAWLKRDIARATSPRAVPVQHVIGHAAALSYLACLRPSELVRIGHLVQLGDPPLGLLEPVAGSVHGVVAIHGKTTYVTEELRVVPLSDEALERLELLRQATLQWRGTKPRRRRNLLADGTSAPERIFPWPILNEWSAAYRGWTRGHAPKRWPSGVDAKTGKPRPPSFASVSPSSLRDAAATQLDELDVTHTDRELLLGHVKPGAWQSYDRIAWTRLREKASRLTLR